jgi:cell division protein FtsI/penicillin-binding protein 2
MNNENIWRYTLLGAIFSLLGFLILGKLVSFQLDPEKRQQFVEEQDKYSGGWHTVYPARGQITDRWGHLLAGNVTMYEVGVNLNQVKNPHTIALTLNVILGLDYSKVRESIENPPKDLVYLVLDDYVSKDNLERLKKYQDEIQTTYGTVQGKDAPSLEGLVWVPKLQRVYPENDFASNILGFVGRDDSGKIKGYFGVEANYDDLLAGLPVTVWIPNDPNRVEKLPNVPEGTSLVLTIDREVQSAMEEIVDQSMDETGAKSATIVVLDPKTGEVLAMATTPRLDLNKYWNYGDIFKDNTPFNRAVSEAYEPGSVYKVLTMSAAIDKGVVTPNTEFIDTGKIEVGGAEIYNWNSGVWGPQTMLGCMQHSLNVCLAWTATQLGAKDFYAYMKSFGIGHLTGVDLSGEVAGRLKVPGDTDWYDAELGTNSFGQGVSATPLQMVTAVSALANNGRMMYPHIVRSIISNGHQYDTEPRVLGIPITTKTALTVSDMLAESLEKEASNALVEGYRVAGKTGTGEIPTPYGYTSDVTNTSFVGWGPVDDPSFVVYIWLEKPMTSIWGSEVAAPIFPKIVNQLVVLLNIPPDKVRHQLYGQ